MREDNTILIVEDDNDINKMLCELLKQNGYCIVAAFSGTEALLHIENKKFDLILLDLMLPGKTGQEILKEVRAFSQVPIIGLTAIGDKETMVELLRTGANDYIVKPFDNNELLARIEVQLRQSGNRIDKDEKESELIYKDIKLDLEQYEGFIDENALGLSKREFEILKLLMESPKKVFSKNNLYESVWRDEFYGDDNTINVHISNIRRKLSKLNAEEEYIQTVWGIGFKLS